MLLPYPRWHEYKGLMVIMPRRTALGTLALVFMALMPFPALGQVTETPTLILSENGLVTVTGGKLTTFRSTALAALEALHREPERVQRLRENARAFAAACRRAGLDIGSAAGEAIVPVLTGDSVRAVALSQRLQARRINVQPIIAPAVPERLARLRFFLGAEHQPEELASTVRAIAEEFAAVCAATPASLVRRATTA